MTFWNHEPDQYAALWCKSAYSFLEGASHPGELVEEAHRLGIRSLALTDRDGLYGVVRAHAKARELGVQLIVGAEITLFDETNIILLAENRQGYANLCRLISTGRLRSPKGSSQVSWDELCQHARGLLALWGGNRSRIVHEDDPDSIAGQLHEAFGDRLRALLTRHRETQDARRERRLRERAQRHGIATIAGREVLYHTAPRRRLQDVLTCIRHGLALRAAGARIHPNGEHALLPPRAFAMLYEDDPASLHRTREVAERCAFSLAEIRYRYPVERLPEGVTGPEWLRSKTFEGARERYGNHIPANVKHQLEKELALIHELEYEGYFLTMHEIVRYCRHADILCQGRGSAANSAVCYCLGITAVDPVRMGLLFERFLSRERAEPPDIDLDIEHDRREQVIQHVYQKYGRAHAAMVANFIRYRPKSAIRDVGKALGLSGTAIERCARLLTHHDTPSPETLTAAGIDPQSHLHRAMLELIRDIQDMPRHLSIHPGGFLLGHEPVHGLVPVENAAMPDRTVIQWDKEDIEELGLFKVDLLGLGALNVVHRAFDLIQQHNGPTLSLATIPPEDPRVYEMIQRADTVGVFQIESRAQMAMLPRLKPANYYDLVIEVSIVRPGPITGGMVHPYLRRRTGQEEITYPHESLKPVLEKTLGIPLFQEQVMQLAVAAADYTPGEADQLRRDMAAWRKSGRIERHRERLITRMRQKGISEEFAQRVFEQIRGFGEYGFPESHAASFALIAYATSWLKCHYPQAYLCAMLNAQPMGFYSPATLIDDAKRHGVTVLPIDATASEWECTLEPQPQSPNGTFAVRMGLMYLKGLHAASAEALLNARREAPPTSTASLAQRAGLGNAALARLAASGALESFGQNRRHALWQALGTTAKPGELQLFHEEPPPDLEPLHPFDTIRWDYDYTGHSPRGHPLAPLRHELTRQNLPDAATIRAMKDGQSVRYAGLAICRQRPGTARGVVFMTLEDETGFVNLVIWESVFAEHAILAKTQSFLGVTGKLQNQSGIAHIIVQHMWTPKLTQTPTQPQSRDFH